MTSKSERREKIAALNDAFRQIAAGGRTVMSAGVAALPTDVQALILHKVANFRDFTADDAPFGEHDFGSVYVGDKQFFWRIECMEFEAGPDDSAQATRILCLMLAEEY